MSLPFSRLTQPGWAIFAAVLTLLAIGVASILIIDTHYVAGHDGASNAIKQLVRAALALGLAMIVLRVGYVAIAEHAYLIFIAALIALIPPVFAKMTGITLGGLLAPRNGAYRWIHLPGFPLQPSEIMKIAYVLALAWYLRYRKNYRNFGGLLLPFVVSFVPLSLILLEPDLGTAILLLPVLLAMLFVAGAKKHHLLVIVIAGLVLAPLGWKQLHSYQRLRVTAVLLQSDSLRQAVVENPEKYASLATKRQAIEWSAGSGYQLVHSKNALGSGGVLGFGWGNGVYSANNFLPDRHNDFIFAMIGHQWGLMGCLLVLLCFGVIVTAGARIASATTDPCGRLVAVGVVVMIAVQMLINVGMTLGLLPITGMTLPFVSYGGSSLLTNFISVALLVSVSQRKPYLLATRPFEQVRDSGERTHLSDRYETQPETRRTDKPTR